MATVKMRSYQELLKEKIQLENVITVSSVEQKSTEDSCLRLFERANTCIDELDDFPVLNRPKTISFLKKGLQDLSEGYECLDASRPWLVYWIVHSLELLGEMDNLSDELKSSIVQFLANCQGPDGGFAGGPGQLPHLAPTYAAVNALTIIGTEEAYKVTDRDKLVKWLDRLRNEDGSFMMHVDGEVDIRGVYCALSAARLLNVYSESLFYNTDQWLLRCQTYEGGFGGCPGMEAHGGYSFCGLAALILLGKERLCDTDNLLLWAVSRQMRCEGGFQGRTNKLVDGCYSFWQGGLFPLLHQMLSQTEDKISLPESEWLCDERALQQYLLVCCQDPRGGLIDKPGKSRDFYHTCYALSGLAVAQHLPNQNQRILGHSSNLLLATHPVYNVGVPAVINIKQFFKDSTVPVIQRT